MRLPPQPSCPGLPHLLPVVIAWPYKGPCTAGGKLAAEALRVLKKSIQHAGARRRGWGAAPLSQLRRALPLRGGEGGGAQGED